MNIFKTLLFNMINILFPLFCYIIFLANNKTINKKQKEILFDFLIITSTYISFIFNQDIYPIINFLLLNSLIIIAYTKNRVFSANIVSILIIVLYASKFNFIYLMIIPYILIFIIYKIKNRYNFKDFYFIDLFLIIHYIVLIFWLYFYNLDIYNSMAFLDNIIIFLFYYMIVHIIYLLYTLGEKIINTNSDYKKLKNSAEIKMSLFKITHEIKNPIAVIKAYLDMMDINNKNKVKEYIPIIKSEIDRLLNLLQDFLLVNNSSINLDIMDINMLIEDVIKKERSLIENKNIKLKLNLIDDEIYINGDYNRLSQVLINIIKNSIEAIDNDNGIIKIKNIIKNNYINIIIEDNGYGISEKNLKMIKEPFYTTKNRGTGLGVSLSDEIVKAHNGILIYDSKEARGTKVTIKLPLMKGDKKND